MTSNLKKWALTVLRIKIGLCHAAPEPDLPQRAQRTRVKPKRYNSSEDSDDCHFSPHDPASASKRAKHAQHDNASQSKRAKREGSLTNDDCVPDSWQPISKLRQEATFAEKRHMGPANHLWRHIAADYAAQLSCLQRESSCDQSFWQLVHLQQQQQQQHLPQQHIVDSFNQQVPAQAQQQQQGTVCGGPSIDSIAPVIAPSHDSHDKAACPLASQYAAQQPSEGVVKPGYVRPESPFWQVQQAMNSNMLPCTGNTAQHNSARGHIASVQPPSHYAQQAAYSDTLPSCGNTAHHSSAHGRIASVQPPSHDAQHLPVQQQMKQQEQGQEGAVLCNSPAQQAHQRTASEITSSQQAQHSNAGLTAPTHDDNSPAADSLSSPDAAAEPLQTAQQHITGQGLHSSPQPDSPVAAHIQTAGQQGVHQPCCDSKATASSPQPESPSTARNQAAAQLSKDEMWMAHTLASLDSINDGYWQPKELSCSFNVSVCCILVSVHVRNMLSLVCVSDVSYSSPSLSVSCILMSVHTVLCCHWCIQ